jgi:hypothetical protein
MAKRRSFPHVSTPILATSPRLAPPTPPRRASPLLDSAPSSHHQVSLSSVTGLDTEIVANTGLSTRLAQNISTHFHDTETDAKPDTVDLSKIYWAARLGQTKTVEALLEGGAEVDIKDNEGLTALYWAARFGRREVIEKILDAGAEVDVKDKDGLTGLYWAARQGYAEVLQKLLNAGAEVDTKDLDGLTGLYWAARHEYTEILQKLLNAGAEVDTKDLDGLTALDWAQQHGYGEVVKILSNSRAKVNMRRNDKATSPSWIDDSKEQSPKSATEMIPEPSGESFEFRSDIQIPYLRDFKASWNRVLFRVVLIVAVWSRFCGLHRCDYSAQLISYIR